MCSSSLSFMYREQWVLGKVMFCWWPTIMADSQTWKSPDFLMPCGKTSASKAYSLFQWFSLPSSLQSLYQLCTANQAVIWVTVAFCGVETFELYNKSRIILGRHQDKEKSAVAYIIDCVPFGSKRQRETFGVLLFLCLSELHGMTYKK